jgi:hypothetical protein
MRAASRLLPVGIVATIAENVFGAVLSARIAGLIDPARAEQMAARLPTPFLADVAVELDPRRAHAVIARIPAERIAAISAELVARGEHVTMGRFVGHLDRDAVVAAVAAMDDVPMLQVAFVLENRSSLADVIDVLSAADRLERVIDAAAAEGLWPETLELLTWLDHVQRAELIAVAAGRDDVVLDALIEAADAHDLWGLVLPLTALMSDEHLRRFAALRALQRDGVLERIVDAAALREDLQADLLPLVALLPGPCRVRVTRHVAMLALDIELPAA